MSILERSARSLVRQSIVLVAICIVSAASAIIILVALNEHQGARILAAMIALLTIATLPHAVESIVYARRMMRFDKEDTPPRP